MSRSKTISRWLLSYKKRVRRVIPGFHVIFVTVPFCVMPFRVMLLPVMPFRVMSLPAMFFRVMPFSAMYFNVMPVYVMTSVKSACCHSALDRCNYNFDDLISITEY